MGKEKSGTAREMPYQIYAGHMKKRYKALKSK